MFIPSGSGSFSRYEQYSDRLDDLIMAHFNSKYKTSTTGEIYNFREKIYKLRHLYEKSVNNKEYSTDITDLMRRDLDSLKIEAENLIHFSGEIPKINITADDIGSFQYTWTNFYNATNISAIILSILLSIMLDILTPVLSLLLYKKEVNF